MVIMLVGVFWVTGTGEGKFGVPFASSCFGLLLEADGSYHGRGIIVKAMDGVTLQGSRKGSIEVFCMGAMTRGWGLVLGESDGCSMDWAIKMWLIGFFELGLKWGFGLLLTGEQSDSLRS